LTITAYLNEAQLLGSHRIVLKGAFVGAKRQTLLLIAACARNMNRRQVTGTQNLVRIVSYVGGSGQISWSDIPK
jgi:hypothetical protein